MSRANTVLLVLLVALSGIGTYLLLGIKAHLPPAIAAGPIRVRFFNATGANHTIKVKANNDATQMVTLAADDKKMDHKAFPKTCLQITHVDVFNAGDKLIDVYDFADGIAEIHVAAYEDGGIKYNVTYTYGASDIPDKVEVRRALAAAP